MKHKIKWSLTGWQITAGIMVLSSHCHSSAHMLNTTAISTYSSLNIGKKTPRKSQSRRTSAPALQRRARRHDMRTDTTPRHLSATLEKLQNRRGTCIAVKRRKGRLKRCEGKTPCPCMGSAWKDEPLKTWESRIDSPA